MNLILSQIGSFSASDEMNQIMGPHRRAEEMSRRAGFAAAVIQTDGAFRFRPCQLPARFSLKSSLCRHVFGGGRSVGRQPIFLCLSCFIRLPGASLLFGRAHLNIRFHDLFHPLRRPDTGKLKKKTKIQLYATKNIEHKS